MIEPGKVSMHMSHMTQRQVTNDATRNRGGVHWRAGRCVATSALHTNIDTPETISGGPQQKYPKTCANVADRGHRHALDAAEDRSRSRSPFADYKLWWMVCY